MAWIYAMYKGDKLLSIGTRDEICKEMNIKLSTFQWYRTSAYHKRKGNNNNRRTIIKVEGGGRNKNINDIDFDSSDSYN